MSQGPTLCIVQARLGSTRLPGKVLKTIANKSVLQHCIERLKRSKYIDDVVIATTTHSRDDELVSYCNTMGWKTYRGSEDNVLERYYLAAKEFSAQHIVRVTSDCPLIDPDVIDKIISAHKSENSDYTSNVLERTYPRGLDAEVLSFKALDRIHHLAVDGPDREHVTRFLLNNRSLFNMTSVANEVDCSNYRVTVDTQEDFDLVEQIFETLLPQNYNFGINDICRLLEHRPDLVRINSQIQQKAN